MNNSRLQISSAQNPRIKHVVKLRDRRYRDAAQQFIIEGFRELSRAADCHWPLAELYVCPELYSDKPSTELARRLEDRAAAVLETTASVFRKMAYRDRPEGILAVAPQMHRHPDDLRLSSNPLLIIAEALEKPGNLGTILRSADATGADALIICDPSTDIFNPNVVRASTGTLFTVPVAEMASHLLIPWLRHRGIRILAATPHATQLYTEIDMTTPVAVAVGIEQDGLTDLWMTQADQQLRIPMRGNADSLNVATATTLILYEAIRQRATMRS